MRVMKSPAPGLGIVIIPHQQGDLHADVIHGCMGRNWGESGQLFLSHNRLSNIWDLYQTHPHLWG
jgi:hypothetical protein